jgi:anti-sigma B factor antagonist
MASAAHLRAAWYAVIDERRPARVVVDLQDVRFMDSSGLSVLAGIAKRQQSHGGTVAVCNPSEQIAKIMTMTRLDRSVPILWSGCPEDVPTTVAI